MELISKKNGLPIRRGVILIAGPDNPFDPPDWRYYVVNPELGHVLDMNNNVCYLAPEDMTEYWVGEWRFLPGEPWWREAGVSLDEEALYHSGICAGDEDERFEVQE